MRLNCLNISVVGLGQVFVPRISQIFSSFVAELAVVADDTMCDFLSMAISWVIVSVGQRALRAAEPQGVIYP